MFLDLPGKRRKSGLGGSCSLLQFGKFCTCLLYTSVADIRPLLDETCYQEYYEHMPKFRQKKADALKLVQGKAQSIGVWYLYEQMKKEYGIQKDAAYNLSHSGEYVLCSVHEGKDPKIRVGCDIEEIGICNMKIARRFFCRSEYEKIDSETNEAVSYTHLQGVRRSAAS